MATNRAVQGRLHVGVVSPWRQAISALFGDSRADVGDLEWELPERCEPGDSVLHVVYSPRPAIGVLMAMSSVADSRDSRTASAAWTTMNGVTPRSWARRSTCSATCTGISNPTRSPRFDATAGR